MNECPTCGRKVRDGGCPYCGEDPTHFGSADPTPVSGESFVGVYSSNNERQADFVISALEAEGIPVHRESSETVTGLDHEDDDTDLTGDIIVLVDEEDADRAREIVKASEHELDTGDH
ncbi:MAG: hypothetical protein ABIJ00_14430 [Candidatus Eisenbacteria bacterium]